jgi:hypothetical protein
MASQETGKPNLDASRDSLMKEGIDDGIGLVASLTCLGILITGIWVLAYFLSR